MDKNQILDPVSQGRTGELLEQQRLLIHSHMQEMETLKKRAEDSNLAKSHFLANISHEIRTPLAAVLGFADVLSYEKLNEDERQAYLAAIRRNGELLLRLIDDILDLSKIESQKLDFEKTEFSIKEILVDAQTVLSFRAGEKGIALEMNSPEDLWFLGDSLRIKQILLNIIGNAVKFTDKGGVKVSTSIFAGSFPDKPLYRKIVITVEDSGPGLSVEEGQKLFQPFIQADVTVKRRFGGTGLGLVISRHLARAMGGDIRLVKSELGCGSVFEISLELEQALEKEAAPAKPVSSIIDPLPSLAGKVILVVDDVCDNRFLIERYLKSHQVVLLQARSGTEALEVLSKNNVDLVLMDIQMPEMDGHEATRRIRATDIEIPIIALTAHAMRDEVRKCMNSGFDAVLTKPTRRQELISLLHKWLCGAGNKLIQ